MTTRNIEHYAGSVFSFDNLEDFRATPIRAGLSTINYNGNPLDVLVDLVEDAKTILMSFHPAATDPKTTRPYFLGKNLFGSIPAHRVYFSDPSLEMDDQLTLAWFAGNQQQQDMQAVLTVLITDLIEKLSAKHTIMVGASGGGFAALYYSARVAGSLALVVNPQTDIMRYWEHHVVKYAQLAWGLDTPEQVLERLPSQTSTSVLDSYRTKLDNSVIYLQNASDSHHLKEHFTPLLNVLHPENRVRFFFGVDWGQGHKPAPKVLQESILEKAVASDGNWSQLLDLPDLMEVPHQPQDPATTSQ